MDGRAILVKTQKGKDEIETRQYHLPSKLRVALILVDGKSDVAHLVEAGHADVEKALEELALLGFIQTVSTNAGPSAASGLTPAAAVLATGSPIKEELIRISRDILGPYADKIVKKIENSADSKEGLNVTLRSCIEVVRLIVDEKKSKTLEVKYNETLSKL